MHTHKVTPKDFFLWAGAMIALYWSVIAFIFLIFHYIDYAFPDALNYYASNPYQSGIGYEMAALIVLFPIYVVLMWIIRSDAAKDPSRNEIWVRRWALILTLFVAALTIAIDLITLLTTFFNGESLTESFVFKTLLILLVAAGAFMHFIAELWGYWDKFPLKKRSVCISVAVLVVLSIISGFFIIGTPMQARLRNLDEQRLQDLQTIQSQIISYWQTKGSLPITLSDLNDSLSGWTAPIDPQTNMSYEYKRVSPLDFELCATFAETGDSSTQISAPYPMAVGGTSDNWEHTAGNVCFDRSIDPSRYPITKTPSNQ